jgi:rubrerythrin
MAETTLTMEQALKVAIKAEIDAYNLYMKTKEKVVSSGTKAMLEELAQQEMGHRKILENVVEGGEFQKLGDKIPEQSRGIAEFLTVSDLKKNASPQDVIIFAMGEEEKAFNFYSALKNHFVGTDLEELFDRLAAEERGHKIKLEDEYETHFMTEN